MFWDSSALWLRIFREHTSMPSSSVLGNDSNDSKECASDSIKIKKPNESNLHITQWPTGRSRAAAPSFQHNEHIFRPRQRNMGWFVIGISQSCTDVRTSDHWPTDAVCFFRKSILYIYIFYFFFHCALLSNLQRRQSAKPILRLATHARSVKITRERDGHTDPSLMTEATESSPATLSQTICSPHKRLVEGGKQGKGAVSSYTRRDEDELLGKEDDPTAGMQKRVPSIPEIDEGDKSDAVSYQILIHIYRHKWTHMTHI